MFDKLKSWRKKKKKNVPISLMERPYYTLHRGLKQPMHVIYQPGSAKCQYILLLTVFNFTLTKTL